MHQPRHSNMLSVAEVAKRLAVSKGTVYRLIHMDELPALRIRSAGTLGSYRIKISDFETYLRTNTRRPPEATQDAA